MHRDECAWELDRTVGPHVDQMRSRTTGKFSGKSIVAIELIVIPIEANTLVLFFQLHDVSRDVVEFFFPHLDVFGFPGCTHDVVHRFGVKQEAALVAVRC